MKQACAFLIVAASFFSASVIAQSFPDGPVANPPGWYCVASGDVVTCMTTNQSSSE